MLIRQIQIKNFYFLKDLTMNLQLKLSLVVGKNNEDKAAMPARCYGLALHHCMGMSA